MTDFSDLLGGGFDPDTSSRRRVEKGVAWEAKVINGVYYVPLSQVAQLLDDNKALPRVSKGIKARVQAQKDRKEMGI